MDELYSSILDFSSSGKILFKLGKYNHKELAKVVEEDRQYVDWFGTRKGMDKVTKTAFQMALDGKEAKQIKQKLHEEREAIVKEAIRRTGGVTSEFKKEITSCEGE